MISPNEMSVDERRSIGVEIGTGGGGFAFTEKHYQYWYVGPRNKASVYIIPASTHGGLSSEVSMAFGLRGLSHVVSTGCTSSTDAIFYASEHIRHGRQDVMLTGGVDAPIAPGILAGFDLMKVLTTEWNDQPERASRPFSADRSGMVLAEGAYVYLLEEMDRALSRGAKVYAEIAGYGSTCDAYHRVKLNGFRAKKPARAMSLAMKTPGSSRRSRLLNCRDLTFDCRIELGFETGPDKATNTVSENPVGSQAQRTVLVRLSDVGCPR